MCIDLGGTKYPPGHFRPKPIDCDTHLQIYLAIIHMVILTSPLSVPYTMKKVIRSFIILIHKSFLLTVYVGQSGQSNRGEYY